jgi:hypothetical protein
MRAPMGRDEKRGNETPSNVDTGDGTLARTVRKHVRDVGDGRSREGEDIVEGVRGVVPSSGCLRIDLAAGSRVEVINRSRPLSNLDDFCVKIEPTTAV